METQTIEKKWLVEESLNEMYNIAIDHAIATVRNSLVQSIAEPLIEKLQALKS